MKAQYAVCQWQIMSVKQQVHPYLLLLHKRTWIELLLFPPGSLSALQKTMQT